MQEKYKNILKIFLKMKMDLAISALLVFEFYWLYIEFSEISNPPFFIGILIKTFLYLPELLTNTFFDWLYFFAIYPFLAFVAIEVFITLRIFNFIFLKLLKKKFNVLTVASIKLIIILILFSPLLFCSNIFNPRMIYCFKEKYQTEQDAYKNGSEDWGLNNCMHSVVYDITGSDNFTSDRVKKYCSKISDNPLPSNIEKFKGLAVEDSFGKRNISFDGYKTLTQKDLCFAYFAQAVGSFEGEFSNYANQLNLCNNVPVKNLRRDYCFYYAVLGQMNDKAMCSLINDFDLRNNCVATFRY